MHISKEGDEYLLLVQGAHYILGPFGEDSDLRRWCQKLPARGGKNGKKRAVVAVARTLGIRLWIMLRDQIDYQEFCRRGQKQSGAACAGMLETGFGAHRHRPVD